MAGQSQLGLAANRGRAAEARDRCRQIDGGEEYVLVDQADKALYQAKELGINRVEQWSQALSDNRAA